MTAKTADVFVIIKTLLVHRCGNLSLAPQVVVKNINTINTSKTQLINTQTTHSHNTEAAEYTNMKKPILNLEVLLQLV